MDGWPTATQCWGKLKLDEHGGRPIAWHPLVDHSADVAACLETLLRQPVLVRRLEALGNAPTLNERTIQQLSAIAFLHDLGKANRGFQNKRFSESERRAHHLPTAGHIRELYPLFRDERLHQRLCNSIPLDKMADWGSQVLELLVAAVSHHGRPWNMEDRRDCASLWQPLDGQNPFESLCVLGKKMHIWFPKAFTTGPPNLPGRAGFQHAYAGLVMLADWLGSATKFFPYSKPGDGDRMEFARARAREALRAVGLDVAGKRVALVETNKGFTDIFRSSEGRPFTPNAVQRATGELAAVPGGLAILESETGSGKTEAALWRFKRLFEAGEVDGLYFALPTRVAATQIHQRVSRVVCAMFPADNRPRVVLAVPGYVRVDDVEGSILPQFKVLWNDDPDDAERHQRWAAENPKRFLAAQIAVGTVDQVLLSNLRVAHAHLRSAALLRHLLVVDEVHASDTYMHALLRSILELHVGAGDHALLLSATLGATVRRHYLLGSHAAPSTVTDAIATPYPCLSWTEGRAERFQALKSDGPGKSVLPILSPIVDAPDAIAEQALDAARNGAKVLVVRNTVDAAVAVQRALEDRIATDGDRHEDRCLLFRCNGVATLHHGRFARDDRTLLDGDVEVRLGRPRRSGGTVVVGTQTLEQSLDIDSDLLITDLCPMDVLLQRIGRLHRHARDDRPRAFAEPRCTVLTPHERNLTPWLKRGAHGLGSVYPDLRIIEATWRQLECHETLCVPTMNRELVERATHPDVLTGIESELGEAWEDHGRTNTGVAFAEMAVAALHRIPRDEPFSELRFPGIDETISTRLGDNDRLVQWTNEDIELPPGPFGRPVRVIAIPAHLCRGIEADAVAEVIERRDGGFAFAFGNARFDYGRYGLRCTAKEA